MKRIFIFAIMAFAAASASAQTDIHKIDFMNFTYQPSCAGDDGKPAEKLTVKDGKFEREKKIDDFTEHFYFDILAVEYGDLNGDNKDEAVINTVCNTGGTGQFSEGFIYSIKGGKPVLLARIEGGDRADGGIRSIKVSDGLVVVDANDSEVTAGACCPEGAITTKYRLDGGTLTAVGTPVKRELYPKQRISFDKGASSKTLTVRIASYDRKRYTVGARVGQILSVTASPAGASAGILDDLDITSTKNGFSAKLPKSGDYSFEVVNDTEKDLEVSITVTIK